MVFGFLALLGVARHAGADLADGTDATRGAEPGMVTLAAFLERVLASHPAARAARLERDVGAAELLAAEGAFDPVLRSKTDFKEKGDRTKADRTDTVIEQPCRGCSGPACTPGTGETSA